ncbi:hypothetical protein FE257_005534 [Aspergillus nanangensis]|uniref:Uncharacterized protein n=1 Tax=Aspergillus nanangensis TaxID=2582783 RepID=A0AAD4GWM9_ASPNN|nr:hypothetical protein FE257_005534 [Aspergillus nanangensis]
MTGPMSLDIVQLYGPGMSFYRSRPKPQQPLKIAIRAPGLSPSPFIQKHTAGVKTLCESNELLEKKMQQLRCGAVQLKNDLMRLQLHVKAFHNDLLVTWQADTLTRLIEVVYEQHGWRLPGGVTPNDHGVVDRVTMSTMYEVAARKIKKETLAKRYRLQIQYHEALQMYEEIVHFRSTDPFRTECTFARWLVSKKDSLLHQYQFWGRLFPLCYGRTVEEASEIF